jgi:hypothetical protein
MFNIEQKYYYSIGEMVSFSRVILGGYFFEFETISRSIRQHGHPLYLFGKEGHRIKHKKINAIIYKPSVFK